MCRTSWGEGLHGAVGEDRSAAGDAGPADSESGGPGAGAWVRDFAEDPADFAGGASGAAGLAVSGAAPAGEARLAAVGVGRERERTRGEVLQALGEGAEATGGGRRDVGEAVEGGGADSDDSGQWSVIGGLWLSVVSSQFVSSQFAVHSCQGFVRRRA